MRSIIDFHTHAFPDALAERAMRTLSRAGGALRPYADGSVAGLRERLREAGAVGVLLPVATNPQKLRSMNDWALKQASAELIPFGAMHPFAPDAFEELERLKAAGVVGVKLHPEYQGYDVEDPRAVKLYRKIASLGMTAVFHAGCDPACLPPCRCPPEALARVLGAFDGANVVAAHMGGYLLWERALRCLAGLPVYLDTSYCQGKIVFPLMKRLVDKHGTKRVLFGSDSPWSDIRAERDLVLGLELGEEGERDVLFANAEGLLGLSE